ncbi:MAG TPA: nuclear transport factor 2 family protein [Pyrinomonadaceae bacterium]|nr:nuclear transport factor 2 family protein [Pyrinomonadaceae bacterium]
MSEQENTRLVQQAYDNFKSGNIEALLGLFSDDITWQLPEIEGAPFAGKRSGRDQVAQFFTTLADAQEVRQFEPQEFIAQGDKVVALGHYAWRVKASGREYEADWAHAFTVRGGKIVGFHEYTDSAAAAQAYQKAISA